MTAGDTGAAYLRERRAAYQRDFRARRPDQRKANRWWTKTRNTALDRLAREYPARFQEILAEERAKTPNPWEPKVTCDDR